MKRGLRGFFQTENPTTISQRLALLALWLYLLSPLLLQPILAHSAGPIDRFYFFYALTSLLWAGALHFGVRRAFVLHLLLAPLYCTTAIDLFLLTALGSRLSSSFISIALTNVGDAGDLLSAYGHSIALVAAATALVYLPGLYAIRRLRMQRSLRIAALFVAVLGALYVAELVREVARQETFEQAALDLAGMELSTPFGALFQAALAWRLNVNAEQIRVQRAHSTLHATKTFEVDDEIYVWVIGESSRQQNWSLFGYARDTTPKLRANADILLLPNLLSTAPLTSLAVPSMLSLQPITDWSAVAAHKSVLEAFNQTGFKTYWLSTQKIDRWGGIIPLIASEAQHQRYFENAFDAAMLDELRSILATAPKPRKLFIVLHTMGSHFDAARRYPSEFARFASADAARPQQVIDSYDNSVLYTDWFLSELITVLARRNTHAALLYASDHGENLYDDARQLYGHNQVASRFELASAAFFWFSAPLRSHRPVQISSAQTHAKAALSLSNLSHSLLDLAGIQSFALDPQMSIFNPSFNARPRWYILQDQLKQATY